MSEVGSTAALFDEVFVELLEAARDHVTDGDLGQATDIMTKLASLRKQMGDDLADQDHTADEVRQLYKTMWAGRECPKCGTHVK